MLLELNVENLLLIERAQLRLAPGLNVLTGETGAGKTVLAHALDLLLGGRARPGVVRPGAPEAYVEGVFELSEGMRAELSERLPAGAQEIVLARRVGADGRTRAYLSGRAATIGDLRHLGERLVSFYGQHEHRKLTLASAQLQVLDSFCDHRQEDRLAACARAYRECERLRAGREELDALAQARGRELDLLQHELAEIDALELQPCEHERLLAARERVRRLDALRMAARGALDAFAPEAGDGNGAASLLAGAGACLREVAGADPRLDEIAVRVRALALEAAELAPELRDYGEGLDGEEGSLQQLEERLAAIERVLRKHGGSPASVNEYAERARSRSTQLAGVDAALDDLERSLERARDELDEHVGALHAARERAAPRLAGAVREQLQTLAMPGADFVVELSARPAGPSGADHVELMIAPNPGVPAGPLREIGSGGELSRAMLAVIAAAAAASHDPARAAVEQPTLMFDEIDAGIGGHAARAVGERLRELSAARQVLCITHLPQIASLASRHFSIAKDTAAEPTLATVVQLAEREVESELVRMLGADERDSGARRHARDLRKAA
jgi:DNA repair protein RecN (Recombination protein N)